MKIFVTGVGGQLGHDVMNELHKRQYEGVGSDLAPTYSGVQDGTAVTTMPYVSMDITDKESVDAVLTKEQPDVVVHCAAWPCCASSSAWATPSWERKILP